MFYKTGRIEPGENKLLYKFFEWYAVLQTNGDGNGKAVQHAAHGGAFLGHVNEDLTYCTISIFTRAKEYGLAIDLGLLGEAPAFGGKGAPFHNAGQFSFQLGIG